MKNIPRVNYFDEIQFDINEKMRQVLIDWLIDVHYKYKMHQQTLAMAVNIIDRYLSEVAVPRSSLQLVGITAIFMAAKYEEIYPPDISDYVRVCNETYSAEEIIDFEGQILLQLK